MNNRAIVPLLPSSSLLLTTVLPSVIYIRYSTSSLAAGVFAISAIYVLSFIAIGGPLWRSKNLGWCLLSMASVGVLIFIHGALAFMIYRKFDFQRFWQSLALLMLFAAGAFVFARFSQRVGDRNGGLAVKLVFCILVLSAAASIAGYSPFENANFRSTMFFFSERSLFALSYIPFLLFTAVVSPARWKWIPILISVLIALALESLTLLIGIGLITIVAIRVRYLAILLPLAAMVLVAYVFPTVDPVKVNYYIDRMTFSQDNKNLSALTYMESWEKASLDFGYSYGLGVGFQQFGIIGQQGDAAGDILAVYKNNEFEPLYAATNGAKAISEFGVIGALLLCVYLWYFGKTIRLLHRASIRTTTIESRTVFFSACFVTYSLDFFVRGAGWFSPTGFMFLASIFWFLLNGRTQALPIGDFRVKKPLHQAVFL